MKPLTCRTPILLLVLFGCVGWSLAASAQGPSLSADGTQQPIELVVRPGGQRSLTPLAVPKTRVEGNVSDVDEVGAQIQHDLKLSGYFKVLGPDRFYFDVNSGWSTGTIHYRNWANVGAAGLVRTRIIADGKNVKLDFRLYDVTNQREIPLKWKPKTVSKSHIQREVYGFVNAVIEYYTGSAGPFGGRVAFAARGRGGYKQIYTIGVDGTKLHRITNDKTIHLLPSWGPGGKVMYTSYASNNPDIWIGSGSSARKFISYPGINSGAALSPSGKEIAVTLSRNGDTEIYIVGLNGKIVRRCTHSASADISPTWSPDGTKIAFVSDRTGGPQIYVMNRDCSGQRRVTMRGKYNVRPEWSPDGSRIVFTGRAGGRFDIFTVRPSSGEIQRITQAQGSNFDATWSPDGRYLIFASTRGGGSARLYLSTADGQIQNLVSSTVTGVQSPRWRQH